MEGETQARVRSTSPAASPSKHPASGVASVVAAEVMSLRSIITLLITWMTPFVACTSGRKMTASRPSHIRWILPAGWGGNGHRQSLLRYPLSLLKLP